MLRTMIGVLLFVATVGIVIVGFLSYRYSYPAEGIWISWTLDEPRLHVAMIDGTLHVVYAKPVAAKGKADSEKALAGFYVRTSTVGMTVAFGVGAPFWGVALVLSVIPTVGLVRGPLRRRRRRRHNQCLTCGYDRTGLTEGRCPECGTRFLFQEVTFAARE